MLKIYLLLLVFLAQGVFAQTKIMPLLGSDLILSQTAGDGGHDRYNTDSYQRSLGVDLSQRLKDFLLSIRYESMGSKFHYINQNAGEESIKYNGKYTQWSLGIGYSVFKDKYVECFVLTRYGQGFMEITSSKSHQTENLFVQTLSVGAGFDVDITKSLVFTGEIYIRGTQTKENLFLDNVPINRYDMLNRVMPGFILGIGYLF